MAYGDPQYWDAYAQRQKQLWEQDQAKSAAVKKAFGAAFPRGFQGALKPLFPEYGGAGPMQGVTEPGPIELYPGAKASGKAAAGGSTATEDTTAQAELDPWISFLLQQQQAQRALALQFAQNQANAGLQQTEQGLQADRAAAAEQYNRQYPLMPTQFLQRGMGTSGIANVGIQRFQQDYVAARQKLEQQYQQARTDILSKLAEAQVTYGTGTVGDLLSVYSNYGPSNG